MKIANTFLFLFFVTISFAQKEVYYEDFESQDIGAKLTSWKGMKFMGWNKSVWKVVEENDNKFGQSSDQQKVFLVKTFDLEAGATYRWSVDTKVVNNGHGWKRSHTLTVTAKGDNDNHKYGFVSVDEPTSNKWNSSTIEFTVLDGKTKVSLQIFRFAEGAIMAVDNYKLTKL